MSDWGPSLGLAAMALILLAVLLAALAARGAARRYATGGADGPAAAPREVRWDGPATCYPSGMVAACQRFVRGMVRGSRRFGPASAEEVGRLAAEAGRLSRKYGVALSGGQLAAMRDMEVAVEAQYGGARALQHGPAMLAASRGGEPVLAIAERLRLPPVAALRAILRAEGYGATEVRAMVADGARMPPRLAREARAVYEADLGSRLNADRIRARSQAYEDALGAHLRGLGLRFRTEDELRAAHAASPGAGPLLTPDYLLDEPALIGGAAVHWIDAKDYPLYGCRLVARSLASQAAKYTKAFGPGAMVFSGGVACGATVLPKSAEGPAPLLLDGSHVARPGA